jgi:lysophospholipase L1-like esterase
MPVSAIGRLVSPDLCPVTPRRLHSFVVACALTALAGCSSTTTLESTDTMPDLGSSPGGSTAATLDEETAEVVSESLIVDDDVDITQIVMIGDSITVGALPYLGERFGALGYPEAIIEAQSGERINVNAGDNPSGTNVVSGIVEEMGWNGDSDHADELWIVALGTNDINQYSTPEELGEAIDSLLAEVPAESEIVWVDTAYVGSAEAADMVNQTLADRTTVRGDSSIAYWSSVAYRDGVLSGDGVHPTEVGSEVFAATVVAAAADAIIN